MAPPEPLRDRGEALARREADEPLDVVDPEGRPTGVIKARREVHRDGDLHRAFHLWIVDGDGRVLIQRRSGFKDTGAGKLDVTVGGHLRAGEYWPQALREVEEEIGLAVEVTDLHALGTFRSERRYEDGTVDRELHETFAMRTTRPLHAFRLDSREVEVLYAVPLAGAVALWRDGTPVFAVGRDAHDRPADALLHAGDLIAEGRADTVPALLALAAWAEGEPGPGPID